MRILAASDIHGSIGWAQQIADRFYAEKADKLLLLGDLLYHGPRNKLPQDYDPQAVTELLNSMRNSIIAVRGNCDTEVDQMVLKFPIMADYAYIVSGSLVIFATHGHVYNPSHMPECLSSGSILLCGHTHIVADEVIEGGIRYMNPGSPSIPKNGSVPSYIIIEDGHAEIKAF
ncbi:hypothetical protein SAMN02910456_00708 [Ruminococcaceae bacterium YRB3002]|nr:hypothetical protein SAMN02910456_00708 [Ruminococcaceae bacterium YRB3002]